MSEVKIHIGDGASLRAMGDRFIAAWNRAADGAPVDERHLSFGTLQEAAAVLTPRRMELLRAIHGEPAASIRAVAQRLGRDYRNVHADVSALIDHSLIDRDDAGGLHADYSGIAFDLAVAF
jgi:predicted transcriptional regulator